MNDGARLLFFRARDSHGYDWREAEAWREFHRRPDAEPMLARPAARSPLHIGRSLAALRRLIPRHA